MRFMGCPGSRTSAETGTLNIWHASHLIGPPGFGGDTWFTVLCRESTLQEFSFPFYCLSQQEVIWPVGGKVSSILYNENINKCGAVKILLNKKADKMTEEGKRCLPGNFKICQPCTRSFKRKTISIISSVLTWEGKSGSNPKSFTLTQACSQSYSQVRTAGSGPKPNFMLGKSCCLIFTLV